MTKARCNYKLEPVTAINQLDDREKQVIEMRLGIGEYKKIYTLREIGEMIPKKNNQNKDRPMQYERVRQIEAKALRKLMHPDRHCKVLRKGYDY